MTGEPSLRYDEEFERHVLDFSWDDGRSTSEVVVYAVAEISSRDAAKLRPLAEVIDPDALDAIFDQTGSEEARNAHISFEYNGYEITIFSHGRLTISEAAS
jgi:hypothetical protein